MTPIEIFLAQTKRGLCFDERQDAQRLAADLVRLEITFDDIAHVLIVLFEISRLRIAEK